MKKLDVLFVNANSSQKTYQELSTKFSAIEPPTWALMLASSCMAKGFGVGILDANAERLNDEETIKRIKEYDPRLVCCVSMGQNPNTSTTLMSGISSLLKLLKEYYPEYKNCIIGNHVSSLPLETLDKHPEIDFVLTNEGVYALHNLLNSDLIDVKNIKGIGRREDGKSILNLPERIVPQHLLDTDLPGITRAIPLLPRKNKPLDLYRSCNWHVNFIEEDRSPYIAIFSSLGCQFKCNFCIINSINRTSNDSNYTAADSPIMRFWSTDFIMSEIDRIMDMGVRTLRFSDEMMLFNKKYYVPLFEAISKRDYSKDLKTWIYSRCDTVNQRLLDLVKAGGTNFIALGIEGGNADIRREASKGSFQDCKVKDVVDEIHNAGINVIANYIFGLEHETQETMQQTFDLSMELLTPMTNYYTASALPGSPLHLSAKRNGYELPDTYEGYSFHSYECLPLRTEKLSAPEILKFRDEAWMKYFTNPAYLNMIENKFGVGAREHIQEMTKIKLKRKILGD